MGERGLTKQKLQLTVVLTDYLDIWVPKFITQPLVLGMGGLTTYFFVAAHSGLQSHCEHHTHHLQLP